MGFDEDDRLVLVSRAMEFHKSASNSPAGCAGEGSGESGGGKAYGDCLLLRR